MYTEDEFLPLSGLAHMAFCERRWALIHIESVWQDNRYTAEGNTLHERAHSGEIETRPGILIRRTLPLHSYRLGLSGQADIVEFRRSEDGETGTPLPGRRGRWLANPVEYKRSRDKAGSAAYSIQLCAQALCLEEMLKLSIPSGDIYDGSAKRRQTVPFDAAHRQRVMELAERMHRLYRQEKTPAPRFMPACRNCSLLEPCMPQTLQSPPDAQVLLREMFTAR